MLMQYDLPFCRLLIDASNPGPEPPGTTHGDPDEEPVGPLIDGTNNANEVAIATKTTAAAPAIFGADIIPGLRISHHSQTSLPTGLRRGSA